MRSNFLVTGFVSLIFGIVVLTTFSRVVASYLSKPSLLAGVQFSFAGFVPVSYPWSLGGTVIGAGLFTFGVWTVSRARNPRAPADVHDMIGDREHLELYVQQEYFLPKIGKKSWALTNLRVIERQTQTRDLKITKDYQEYSYPSLARPDLHQGPFRSQLTCKVKLPPEDTGGDKTSLILDKLTKHEAREADRYITENINVYQAKFFENPLDPKRDKGVR